MLGVLWFSAWLWMSPMSPMSRCQMSQCGHDTNPKLRWRCNHPTGTIQVTEKVSQISQISQRKDRKDRKGHCVSCSIRVSIIIPHPFDIFWLYNMCCLNILKHAKLKLDCHPIQVAKEGCRQTYLGMPTCWWIARPFGQWLECASSLRNPSHSHRTTLHNIA